VSLRIIAVLIVLLIVMGMPSQFATTIGLVGAGLTVALKDLQVVVPVGRNPYPIVEAITKQVVEATADSARQAEQEWQRAVPAQRGKVFSGTPGINVKPVGGGVEIAIRYITRANERFLVRAKLYQTAVDLLGANPMAQAVPK
jgi:hypothetical protein